MGLKAGLSLEKCVCGPWYLRVAACIELLAWEPAPSFLKIG